MSHTDKDAPAWVRGQHTNNRTAYHHPYCVNAYEHRARYASGPTGTRPCDLDSTHTHGWRDGCYYWPEDRTKYPYTRPPSSVARHIDYFAPERAAVRDSLHNARRDWNTYGDTDVEPPTRQARASTWQGGWWD